MNVYGRLSLKACIKTFDFFQLSDVNDNHPTIEDFDIVFNNRINEYFSGAIGYSPAKGEKERKKEIRKKVCSTGR